MKSYLDLLNKITRTGYALPPAARQNVGTHQINNHLFEHDLREGFPLLTTKKMFFRGVVAELLWFLSGSTNIRPLVEQDVHIWDKDAFNFAVRNGWRLIEYMSPTRHQAIVPDINNPRHMDIFLGGVMLNQITTDGFEVGSIGLGYGAQMRNFNGQGVDQISILVNSIRAAIESGNNDRRLIVNMWNPSQVGEVALPWCHKDFQVILEPIRAIGSKEPFVLDSNGKIMYYLNLTWGQRSVDVFLGAGFNIASYALLAHILAQQTGTIAKSLVGELRNVHLYDNHLDAVADQLERTPYPLPTLNLAKAKDIFSYTPKDFRILNYNSHPALKADMVS